MRQENLREWKLEWKVLFNEFQPKIIYKHSEREEIWEIKNKRTKIKIEELPMGLEGSA